MRQFVLLACTITLTLCATRAAAQPVDDRPVRFEPPDVDRVYPAPEEDTEPAPEEDVSDPPEEPSDAQPAPPAAEPPQDAPAEPLAPPAEPPAPPSASPAGTEDTAGDVPVDAPVQPPPAPQPQAEEPVPEPALPSYGASARRKRADLGRKEVALEDARDLPGTFGDPLRVVELMPGVVPISNGLPYFYSRGSPPASQGYRYDGVLLPQIFHLGIGPQVLHPRMVRSVDYYGAVAPADYGRRTGALVDADPVRHRYSLAGELELRLLDVTGFVEAPVAGGNVQFAGRYGYPGLVLKAFSPETTLTYWDGQLRYELPLTPDTRVQLMWIGSFDDLDQPPFGTGATETTAVRLHFHRLSLRVLHDTSNGGEVGASLRFGFDDSSLGTAVFAKAFTVGPRVWYRTSFGDGHRLAVGADMLASTGDVRDEGGTISGIDGQIPVELPALADASARNQGGAYSELQLRTSADTDLRIGGRVDLWKVQEVINVGVDPRIRFSWQALEKTQLHAAVGLAHQPTVFLLPLPGLSEVALSRGLTRSYQAEIGARQDVGDVLFVEVTPFFSYQDDVLLPELVIDGEIAEDPPLVDAQAYGLELYAEGDIDDKFRFMGSYTLGYARAQSPPSVLGDFRPDFDVRHVVNFTGRYDFPSGFNIGLRLGLRSGRLIEQQNRRYAQRLPWFVRLDARVGYGWQGRWAWMDAYLEGLNVTARREYLDADCFFGQCRAESAPPIVAPNLGVRATFD